MPWAVKAETKIEVSEDGGTIITLDQSACALLREYVPSSDVAYQEGVDAYGNAVEPADLAGTRLDVLPEEITIALDLPLGDVITLPEDSEIRDAKVSIGTIKYDLKSGALTFNDQPLTPEGAETLRDQCESVVRTGK